jgi:hypothetical protein
MLQECHVIIDILLRPVRIAVIKKTNNWRVLVAHAHNPSYLEAKIKRIMD